jgi:hypothetical protein
MRCEIAQERILKLGAPDPEAAGHVAQCEACRDFLSLQHSLDEGLSKAYAAPALSPAFRAAIYRRIRSEKRRVSWDALPAMIAPGAALVTTAICALLAPAMSHFLWTTGLILSAIGCLGQVLFAWLTEELGEG